MGTSAALSLLSGSFRINSTTCRAQVGWKTILMKDAYEALYCSLPSFGARIWVLLDAVCSWPHWAIPRSRY